MNQPDVPEPQKEIAAILTRNAAFYHEDPDDETLYYVDPGTILALAYQIMQYVSTVFGFGLPIISGTRWAHAYLKKRRAAAGGGADATTPDVPDQYLSEQAPAILSEQLDALRGKLQDSKLQGQIRANVQEILEFHGWAAAEAIKDAELILSVLTPKAPEYKVNDDYARYRDFLIVRVEYDRAERDGEQSAEIVRHIAGRPPDLNPSAGDDTVNAPLVFLEGDRQDLGTSLFYIDPPEIGQPLSSMPFLAKLGGFWALLDSNKVIEETTSRDYAFGLLTRAVDHAREERGGDYARGLVRRLHEHRWTGGSSPAALLLLRAGSATSDDVSRKAGDEQFLMDRITATRDEVERAKAESTSLTDWTERLYLVRPDILELMQDLRISSLPMAKRWYRYFAEVDADISPVFLTNAFTVVSQELRDVSAFTWTKAHIVAAREGKDRELYVQGLDYLLTARTTIPEFWHDAAVACYDTDEGSIPQALDEVEPYRAVSIDVLEAYAMRWSMQ